MDRRVEVPLELLVDLLDLSERAIEELRSLSGPTLPDALNGAVRAIKTACFEPCPA